MSVRVPTHEAMPYDFRRPNKVSRDQVRGLQIVHETFARQLSTILSTTLRGVSPVTVRAIEQQTYDEYLSSLSNPTCLALLRIEPLPGTGLIHLPHAAALEIVERLLGGPGGGGHPARPLTEIEVGVLRGLLERTMRELTYAFESFVDVTADIVGVEANPQLAQVTALGEMVIVARYAVRIGDLETEISLCCPYPMLQPALEAFARSAGGDDHVGGAPEQVRAVIDARLHEAPVPVSVHFNTVVMTSGEIVDLRPGDILPLAHPTSEPLTVEVGGVSCFRAVPGKKGRRMACMILSADTDGREGRWEPPTR